MRENEGSIYQGAASCNESHLIKECFRECVLFSPLVCMKIQSTNKVSAKKKPANHGSEESLKIAIFLTFRKVIPPKKTTSALTESLDQLFSGFRWNLGSLVTYIFGGDVLKTQNQKKTPCFFFPGQKCCCWMFSDGRIGGLKEMSSNRY